LWAHVRLIWPRRVAAPVLGACDLVGALLLLTLVMELHEPAWSRLAITLQLLALALGVDASG
jgi:hypothetical protein